MKRLVSLILAVALCAGAGAFAADTHFADVRESDYFHDAVHWAVDNGVTAGVSETAFAPNGIVTRAQVVTFLWRIEGEPASETAAEFTDVAAGTWYTDAVGWAVRAGVTNGYPDGRFLPDAACTREQAAAFLYRYEQEHGGGFVGTWAFPLDYSDAGRVSDWAREPLCWMTMNGIMNGYGGKLDPQGLCSRAQLITMLYRYRKTDPAFTEEEIPVLRGSLDSAETAKVRIYEDMPNVPYMSVTDYYDQFCLVDTDVTEGMTCKRDGNKFTLTSFAGYSAVFDTAADSVTVDNMMYFTMLAYDIKNEQAGGVDGNYPFMKTTVEWEPKDATPLTLPLGDYHIDLRGDDTGVYAPLATLGDFFANNAMYYTVYACGKVYVKDYGQRHQQGAAINEDPDYAQNIRADRPADLAEYTYNELCFNVDYFYGRPGQEWLHDVLENKKLDAVLSEDYPEIKELLRASEFTDFGKGLAALLWGLLYDGHTNLAAEPLLADEAFMAEIVPPLVKQDYGEKFVFWQGRKAPATAARRAYRAEVLGDGYYFEKGDTALITFDDFLVDSEGWKAFYAGKGERPLAGDCFGTVLAGLERAAKNPAIKNIVIDMSNNNGGDTGGMMAVENLLTGMGHTHYANLQTKQVMHQSLAIDLNFDGVFDEKDASPYCGYHFGVLTSAHAFSCGNAFPWFMHEHGAMILGERTSGGACAIRGTGVGGLECIFSAASSCITTDSGESVDFGCPVDTDLLADGENPYANFYDLDALSAAMNEFFGENADAAA